MYSVSLVAIYVDYTCMYHTGFFVGKEGPMIHSGAIIGAGLPQLRSMLCKFIKLPYAYFRSDRCVYVCLVKM